ncbi:SGNH/GDSL hydrolase family protein [Aeromicrobium sp. NPDC092404]|uniref:SGNH/GDSL hydrolase family protein n=1 Tax=Aeromicrobium sp. NPDC092404 TaxID=3154976 RepID=UPI00342517AD
MLLRRAAAALVAGTTALVLGACTGSDPEQATQSVPMYVALGDSYVSGAIGKGAGTCGRGDDNYPHLVARALRPMTVRDASCGGAGTANVLSSAPLAGTTLPAQLDDVPADADLVTLGIGANDGNLYPAIFYGCFIESQIKSATACGRALAKAPTILATTRTSIVSTIDAVRRKAPRAEVVLVGYLRLAPDSGDCPDLGAGQLQVRQFAQVEALLAQTQAAAAEEAGVPFVPVHERSAGHDACADDAWTNALTAERGDGILLHPRAAGMEAVARMLEPVLADTSARQR